MIFYFTSCRLNMFQALLCPSTGAHDYGVVYHTGRVVLGLLYIGGEMRLGWTCRLKHNSLVLDLVRPDVGHGLLIHEVSRSHTKTHHIR